MKISDSEIRKALKIKNAVQAFLEQTQKVNLRSTDVFPYLVRRGLFEQDSKNGLYFRRFLKKLYKANMLRSLIPQCTYVPGINGEIFGEWYFNIHRSEIKDEQYEETQVIQHTNKDFEDLEECQNLSLEEAKKNLWLLIEGKHPKTGNFLISNEDPVLKLISHSLKTFIDAENIEAENSQENLCNEETVNNKVKPFSNSTNIDSKEKVNSYNDFIEQIRKSHSNAYKPWTKKEENLLIELYNKGLKIKEIAVKLERQNGAISSRLRKLEIMK
jgi:hypothetical protein